MIWHHIIWYHNMWYHVFLSYFYMYAYFDIHSIYILYTFWSCAVQFVNTMIWHNIRRYHLLSYRIDVCTKYCLYRPSTADDCRVVWRQVLHTVIWKKKIRFLGISLSFFSLLFGHDIEARAWHQWCFWAHLAEGLPAHACNVPHAFWISGA